MKRISNLVYKISYAVARTTLGSAFIRWMVKMMNKILPIDRLRETPTLIAFFHPRPSYPFHVLLIPKRGLKDIQEINEFDKDFLFDLFQTAGSLVTEYGLENKGYRLIVNGGLHQDVELLHFHLINDTG